MCYIWLAVTRARTFSLIVLALRVFTPLTVERPVMLQLNLLSFQVVTIASTIGRKSTRCVITDSASGRLVTYHDETATIIDSWKDILFVFIRMF